MTEISFKHIDVPLPSEGENEDPLPPTATFTTEDSSGKDTSGKDTSGKDTS